mmetsp:Transcript_4330/g.7606  ORF Transcript_4330/g.7606 Transcript_4330/m.7606 type:complete len:566 (-) Transcript_4330:82-1779(-)|eukprot:CAMPEP_0197625038 /NCGR_PEP_ID=MMETSP1338-20131121/4504_1 /TAXON_ID=43686 ORGANISM="Pelagodinium beii, Strain RCC1491" /NCGR_SAMPLE_ID=MMETSP1338 /ASSEMBLY_ACC=CAM_ASM_000754 /LENGTH=565 /DNA_ID=CAMNT_0043195337 /DNA_START=133 /DNA_END=1830 /DNA_ORIENTATION=-
MTRKKTGGSLGNSIVNSRKRADEAKGGYAGHKVTGVAESQAARSVLEQTSLDDFIASANLARTDFQSTRGEAFEMTSAPQIISQTDADAATEEAKQAAAKQVVVPIPWRPKWREGMSAEDLAVAEGEAFLEWRRGLAKLEEHEGLVMTPYERNLDFWRQLWRCVERSDVIVQILDTRDPEFYRCKDLENYIKQFEGKRHMLLLNKADFLSPELRQRWAAYLADRGIEAVFFSALRELHRQQRVPLRVEEGSEDEGEESQESDSEGQAEVSVKLPPHGSLAADGLTDVADCTRLLEELQKRLPDGVGEGCDSRRGVIGFVGYPNVGKSSVINALFGVKKVSMSRTPGKTKHLQTLELADTEMTLCDCPGLVFPSVVATKSQLVINGTVPLTELRDFVSPVRLVVDKVGPDSILKKYGVSWAEVKEGYLRRGVGEAADDMANQVLCGLATKRNHFLRVGVPDETWAARKVLLDFVTGSLLHCELPPGSEEELKAEATVVATVAEEDEQSDFSDLDDFLQESASSGDRKMTKRKMRQLNKQMLKGGAVAVSVSDKKPGKDVRGKKSLG